MFHGHFPALFAVQEFRKMTYQQENSGTAITCAIRKVVVME